MNYAPCISLLGSAPPLLLYSFQRGPFPSLSCHPLAPAPFVPRASYLFRLQVVKWPGLVRNLPLCSRGVIKKAGLLLLLLLLLLPSLLVNRCSEFHFVNRGCPLLSYLCPPFPQIDHTEFPARFPLEKKKYKITFHLTSSPCFHVSRYKGKKVSVPICVHEGSVPPLIRDREACSTHWRRNSLNKGR